MRAFTLSYLKPIPIRIQHATVKRQIEGSERSAIDKIEDGIMRLAGLFSKSL